MAQNLGKSVESAKAGKAGAPNETDEIPVEITPEMIEAGAEVLCGADIWPPDRRRDWAIEVYRAMAALDGSRRNPSPVRSPKEQSQYRDSIGTRQASLLSSRGSRHAD